jgi:hypothetical protein
MSSSTSSTDPSSTSSTDPNPTTPKAPSIFDTTACQNEYSDVSTLPLKEYMIKSSFNSAYDGTNVSLATLEQCMAEGYRYLDFDLYCASGSTVYCGFSQNNAPGYKRDLSAPSLLFSEVLTSIKKNAFLKSSLPYTPSVPTAVGVPTIQDTYSTFPIFVHLRIYRSAGSTVDIIKHMLSYLDNDPRYLREPDGIATKINGCTSLDQIGPKIVFSMDIANILQVYAPTEKPSMDEIDPTTRSNLDTFVNVFTGGSTFRAFYSYEDANMDTRTKTLRVLDSGKQTNVVNWYIVYPYPTDIDNPDPRRLVMTNSIQTIPNRRYMPGPNYNAYLRLFDSQGTPFVPLYHAYGYFKQTETGQ